MSRGGFIEYGILLFVVMAIVFLIIPLFKMAFEVVYHEIQLSAALEEAESEVFSKFGEIRAENLAGGENIVEEGVIRLNYKKSYKSIFSDKNRELSIFAEYLLTPENR